MTAAAIICICFMILVGFVFYHTLKHRRITNEANKSAQRSDCRNRTND
jgi:phosphotransferase system  glucose/maltose/N-acetylglucosamine-specific IIC component